MQNNLTLGQQVTNFGITATIVNFHPVTGDPVLQDAEGMRWIADAAKCEPVMEYTQHAGGLVVFG